MRQEGFTIIELIIAIFILSVAIIGIYNAFSVIIVLTADASDRLTAAYLAQEGMELVRNVRDTNWLTKDSYDWADGLLSCEAGCQADYTLFNGLSGYNGEYLKINPYGFYSYDLVGMSTKFQRKIIIHQFPDTDNALKVSVEVFWKEKPNILNISGAVRSIKVEETLFNWY